MSLNCLRFAIVQKALNSYKNKPNSPKKNFRFYIEALKMSVPAALSTKITSNKSTPSSFHRETPACIRTFSVQCVRHTDHNGSVNFEGFCSGIVSHLAREYRRQTELGL
ncbi:unnamed protein product [Staurois parvus]|uniref:Uncharacterized protein n=1 Tax=Staurois parvus TaxID=386267 RepID=A0ABN9EZI5_9NEOB|nr:unnamed protein product [Staurois parvus]